MSKLDELNAAIEKAAMRFGNGVRRVSRRQKRAIRYQHAVDSELRSGKRRMVVGETGAYSVGPNRRGSGGKRPPSAALTALRNRKGRKFQYGSMTLGREYRPNAIRKARSAFSGGSSKAFNRVGRIGMKAINDGDVSRFSRASSAQRYLARRKRNAFHGGENWRTSLPRLRGGKYK